MRYPMQPGLLAPSTLLHQRYCIEKQVGTGGFGAVYKARDTLFSHRLVAIKEMNQSGLSPRELAEASAAFQHEALFLAGLAHPHLPRIHDQFAEQGRSYMVMDFIIFTYTQHSKGGAEGSLQGVTSVTWSPNGKYIASGASDGTVQLWNASPVPAP